MGGGIEQVVICPEVPEDHVWRRHGQKKTVRICAVTATDNPQEETSEESKLNIKIPETVLVTQTIPLEEVLKEAHLWLDSMKDEIFALKDMQAIESVFVEDVQVDPKLILPGKSIFTKKPDEVKGFRYKTRAVICGNFEKDLKMDVFTAGCDGIALRLMLRWSALDSFPLCVIDVKNAFLNARLDEVRSEPTYMKPPNIFLKLGLVKPNELWRIHKALYGLRDAPLAWSKNRDSVLSSLQFEVDGISFRFTATTTEPNLWCIHKADNTVV